MMATYHSSDIGGYGQDVSDVHYCIRPTDDGYMTTLLTVGNVNSA